VDLPWPSFPPRVTSPRLLRSMAVRRPTSICCSPKRSSAPVAPPRSTLRQPNPRPLACPHPTFLLNGWAVARRPIRAGVSLESGSLEEGKRRTYGPSPAAES